MFSEVAWLLLLLMEVANDDGDGDNSEASCSSL